MNKETLRLFNALQVNKKVELSVDKKVLKRTVQRGYILDPSIAATDQLLDTIETVVGISGEKANAAFHKSWEKVQNAPIETLVIEQIVHYITTYGYQALGVYSEDTVYIPDEVLDFPKAVTMPLTVVKALNKEEILECIVKLSSIALSPESLSDIMVIVVANKYDSKFVENIKNRELKALLFDHYGIVPSDPTEFLRHLISKLTDESLVIKNRNLIEKIKESNGKFLGELLKKAPDDLASIFLRYKPLFLAMKTISKDKTFFNRLRKQATSMHKPLGEDYLNSVTGQIKNDTLNLDTLAKRLDTATIFRKVRLANAINYRLHANGSIVYRVRSGRGWATDFDWSGKVKETKAALDVVKASIAKDIAVNVKGKTIYIPSYVYYALPATEKQFTGNFPTGTSVAVPENMICGINWKNTKKVVDLDLATIDAEGKIGWDAAYRSDSRDIMFSGDITNACGKNGATELFHIRRGISPKIMTVNYFNYSDGDEVVAKVMVAHESPKNWGGNYMVDVNNIFATANVNITQKNSVLGLLGMVDGETRFCFANVAIGNSISSRADAHSTHARKHLMSVLQSIDLREILTMAGANVVDERPEDDYTCLAPESLDKTTIINLLNV